MHEPTAMPEGVGERAALLAEIEEYTFFYESLIFDDAATRDEWFALHPRFAAYWAWQRSLDPQERYDAAGAGDRHFLNWYFDGRPASNPPVPAPPSAAPVLQSAPPTVKEPTKEPAKTPTQTRAEREYARRINVAGTLPGSFPSPPRPFIPSDRHLNGTGPDEVAISGTGATMTEAAFRVRYPLGLLIVRTEYGAPSGPEGAGDSRGEG